MDKANIYIMISGVLFFAIAFSVIGAIPWVLDSTTQAHTVVNVDGETVKVPNPYNVGDTAQLTVVGDGRQFYMNQICYQCHSQFVRPLAHEVDLYGPPSQAGESSWDTPMLFGTKRTGPDLAREGGKRTDDWHLAHFYDPIWTVPESVMQPYDSHFVEDAQPITPFKEQEGDRETIAAHFDSSPMPVQMPGEQQVAFAKRLKDWRGQKAETAAQFALIRKDFVNSLAQDLGYDDWQALNQGITSGEVRPQVQAWNWRDGWVRHAIELFDMDANKRLDKVEADRWIRDTGREDPFKNLSGVWVTLLSALDFDDDKIISLSDARPQPSEDIEKLVHYLQYLGTAIGDWRQQEYTGKPERSSSSPVVKVQNEIIELDRWISDAELLAANLPRVRRLYGDGVEEILKPRSTGEERLEIDWSDAAQVGTALADYRQKLIQEELVMLWRDGNARGRTVYENKCQGCHGVDGNGSGDAVMFLGRALNKYRYMEYGEYVQQVVRENDIRTGLADKGLATNADVKPVNEIDFEKMREPLFGDYLAFPRDFTQGIYKFASRPKGQGTVQVPTDADLYATISRGIYGSSMPGWHRLAPEDRWAVIDYIKAFSLKEQTIGNGPDGDLGTADDLKQMDSPFLKAAANAMPLPVPAPPRDLDSEPNVWEGRFLFVQVGCVTCHGPAGQADDYVQPENWTGRNLQARNFTQAPLLKGGNQPQDIFRTLRNGIEGTPMPPHTISDLTFAGGEEAAKVKFEQLLATTDSAGQPAYDRQHELEPLQAWLASQPDAEAIGKMTGEQKERLAHDRIWSLVAYVRWLMETKGRVLYPSGEPPAKQ